MLNRVVFARQPLGSHAIATMALVRDTFREALARRIFIALFGFSTALIVFFLFVMKVDVVEGTLATVTLMGQSLEAQNVNQLVRQAHSSIAAFLFGMGLVLSVFASAGMIPTLFEPGRIELILSKPVSRTHILLGRYLGNLIVVAANIVYLVVSVWLIFGVKTGVWTYQFLFSTVLAVYVFAILLSIILFVSVMWDSPVLATLTTFAVMTIGTLVAQRALIDRLVASESIRAALHAVYYALPKTWEIGSLARQLVLGHPIGNWMPLWSSALFGAVMLGASLFVFSRRDY
jgi:ABC-2 type transport system permease protein